MFETVLNNTLKMVRKNTEIDAKRAPAGTPKKVFFNTVLDSTERYGNDYMCVPTAEDKLPRNLSQMCCLFPKKAIFSITSNTSHSTIFRLPVSVRAPSSYKVFSIVETINSVTNLFCLKYSRDSFLHT